MILEDTPAVSSIVSSSSVIHTVVIQALSFRDILEMGTSQSI